MKKQYPNRPANMSQLDYLWTTYGPYTVSDSLDVEDSIPSSKAIKDAIATQVTGIVELDTKEEGDKIRVIGKGGSGEEISSILLDKDTKIVSFERYLITQEDIDNGFGNALNEEWLVLITSNGDRFEVSLEDFIAKGQITNTIITQTKDGKIASELKINNPITNKSVDLKTSESGVYADLVLDTDADSNVVITKGDKGVVCKFSWEGTESPVRIQAVDTYDEYLLLTVNPTTIYFIRDIKSIYLNGVKYASEGGGGLDPSLYYTKSETDAIISNVETDLDNKVSLTDGNIVLEEGKGIVINSVGGTKNLITSNVYGGIELGDTNASLEIHSNARPAVVVGESADELALMSDVTPYVWNDVVTAKAARLADLPESYPVGTLTVKHAGGEITYDGSEDVSVDLTHIQQAISELKDELEYKLSTKQDKLVSGTNIKRINGQSILGNGDILISSDFTAIRYKGSVATYADLPSAPEVGDIYNVILNGANYAWNGEVWETYGTITPVGVDLYKEASGEITGGEVRFSDNTVLPINIFIK